MRQNLTKANYPKKKQHWHIFLLRMRRIMFIFWARVFLWRAGFDSFNQSSWVRDIWSNQWFDFFSLTILTLFLELVLQHLLSYLNAHICRVSYKLLCGLKYQLKTNFKILKILQISIARKLQCNLSQVPSWNRTFKQEASWSCNLERYLNFFTLPEQLAVKIWISRCTNLTREENV